MRVMLEGKLRLASRPGWDQRVAEVPGVGPLTCGHELTIGWNIARYTATDASVESQEVELPTHGRGTSDGRCSSGRATIAALIRHLLVSGCRFFGWTQSTCPSTPGSNMCILS